MIRHILLWLKRPALRSAFHGVKEIRALAQAFMREAPDRRLITAAKARFHTHVQKAYDRGRTTADVQFLFHIDNLLSHVAEVYLNRKDNGFRPGLEIRRFLAGFSGLLGCLQEHLAAVFPRLSRARSRAEFARGMAELRKTLRRSRLDALTVSCGFPENLELTTMYTHFEQWLDLCDNIADNAYKERRVRRQAEPPVSEGKSTGTPLRQPPQDR